MSSNKSVTAVAKFADALSTIADQVREANLKEDGRVVAVMNILTETGLLSEGDAERLITG